MGAGVCLAALLLAFGGDSRAEVAAQCANSFENAQVFRKKGQFSASRKELSVCMRDCPGEIQRQCRQWFDDLDAVMPSIIIQAQANGNEQSDVKVQMDGKALADKLDGKAISMDPGQHVFTFTTSGYPPVTKSIILHEGEQLRVMNVAFERPEDAAESPSAPAASPDTVASHATSRPVPPLIYVLGGVAVVGGIGFAALGITADNERSKFEITCSPRCPYDDVRALHSKLIMADVSLGVGIAALTAGAIVWFTRPAVPLRTERAALDIVPTRGGATATATIGF
jgi:hypothetical protein